MGTAPSRGGRAAGGREPPPSPRRGASLPPSQRAGGRGRGPTEIGLSLHELGCRDWSQPQGRVSSTWETPNVSKDATLAEKMLGFFLGLQSHFGGKHCLSTRRELGHPCGAPLGCGSLSAHFGGPELGGSSTTYTGSERAMPRQPKSSHTVVALVSYKQTPDSWVEKHIPVSPPEESSLAHPSLRLIPLTHCAAAVNSCPRRL